MIIPMDKLTELFMVYGIQAVAAIVILIIGRIAAGWARRGTRKMLEKSKTDPSIVGFVSKLVYYVIIIFTLLAVLKKFGVETASFIAVLGAAGFAVGFALQGSLSNFAAGLMLLVFRPYKVGDFVDVAGASGTVKDMGLFTTTMNTPDNIRIIVPNGKIFGDTIKNFSAEDIRRAEIIVGVAYGTNINLAFDAVSEQIREDQRILVDPAPMIVVGELADSSVNLITRVWVKKEDFWAVKFALTKAIKEQFDRKGIEIPFPQRVVHTVSTK